MGTGNKGFSILQKEILEKELKRKRKNINRNEYRNKEKKYFKDNYNINI